MKGRSQRCMKKRVARHFLYDAYDGHYIEIRQARFPHSVAWWPAGVSLMCIDEVDVPADITFDGYRIIQTPGPGYV